MDVATLLGTCVARMTMKADNGLEFPVVALAGVGHMPAAGEDKADAARVCFMWR